MFGCCVLGRLGCFVQEDLPVLQPEKEGVLLSSILKWINQKSPAVRIGADESFVKLRNMHPDKLAPGAFRQLRDHLLRESQEKNRAARALAVTDNTVQRLEPAHAI